MPDPVSQGILREEELPPLPENFHYDPREPLQHRVMRRDDECLIHWKILRQARRFSTLDWRYFAWSLYRFVEKVDAEIGLVLDTLAASRFRDDTIVIFTADHGEAAGQHQMFQKFTLYDLQADPGETRTPGRRPGPGGDPGRAAHRARCRRAPPRKATTRSRRTTRGSRSVGRPPPRTLAGSPAIRASQWR